MPPYRMAVAVSLAIPALWSQSVVSSKMITNEASASGTMQGQQSREMTSRPVIQEQERSVSSENITLFVYGSSVVALLPVHILFSFVLACMLTLVPWASPVLFSFYPEPEQPEQSRQLINLVLAARYSAYCPQVAEVFRPMIPGVAVVGLYGIGLT